jgi:hypothetical protein
MPFCSMQSLIVCTKHDSQQVCCSDLFYVINLILPIKAKPLLLFYLLYQVLLFNGPAIGLVGDYKILTNSESFSSSFEDANAVRKYN